MFKLSLAYMGLGATEVSAWIDFAMHVLGMQEAGQGADGERLLRCDERPWRLAVHPSAVDDVIYAGYEVADARSVAQIASAVRDKGYSVHELTSGEIDRRNVLGGVAVMDPDGLRVEVVHGFQDLDQPFQSPVGASFVTGSQGMGHMVISTENIEHSMDFYRTLGFQISDYIETDLGSGQPIRIVFLHCNERHHTLALLPVPTPKRLDHIMLEVRTIDDVIIAYYRAQRAQCAILRHLGRHTNDHMLSFYVNILAGFAVEYGWGGRQIHSDWTARSYDAISIWGHAP